MHRCSWHAQTPLNQGVTQAILFNSSCAGNELELLG